MVLFMSKERYFIQLRKLCASSSIFNTREYFWWVRLFSKLKTIYINFSFLLLIPWKILCWPPSNALNQTHLVWKVIKLHLNNTISCENINRVKNNFKSFVSLLLNELLIYAFLWIIVLWCDKYWFESLYKCCVSSAGYSNRTMDTKIDLKGWNNKKPKILRGATTVCMYVWGHICKIASRKESSTYRGMMKMQNYRKFTFGITRRGEPWKWKIITFY